jgi:hypothetical protein
MPITSEEESFQFKLQKHKHMLIVFEALDEAGTPDSPDR